jgi:hypothetical protein
MLKAKMHYVTSAAAMLGVLTLAACGREPAASTGQSGQPDTVVTSRSERKAVLNPRRGSFKRSDPNAPASYYSPDDVHKTTPEPRSKYTQ